MAASAIARGAFTLKGFTNLVTAAAPNLLLIDPTPRNRSISTFTTQTYDVEVGDSGGSIVTC